MKQLFTIGLLTAAAISVVPPAAFADGDRDVTPTPYYERGPRIIQVPQRDEIERIERRASLRDDREVSAPSPRRHRREAAPKPQRRADAPLPRKPFSVSPPPPAGPRRAVLSAPPPRIGEPTPRFEEKAEVVEKLVVPPETAVTAEAPPPGYTPPPLPADEQSTDDQ